MSSVVAVMLGSALCAPARADGEGVAARRKALAAERYDQAATAFEARDYRRAGVLFEAAHVAVPSQVALEQAIRSYELAKRPRDVERVRAELAGKPGEAPEPAPVEPPQPAPAVARASTSDGLPPEVFYGALVLTAGMAAVTVWSASEMYAAADDYERALRDGEAGDPRAVGHAHFARTRAQAGETRTRLLLGASVALGVTSGLLGLLWTDFDHPDEAPPVVQVGSDGRGLRVQLRGTL
ncbi:MAG: hypothetical protein OXT09_23785 [Myxococcales bacterium]|nr:hypothetical protein [Myxococcales bacterium]